MAAGHKLVKEITDQFLHCKICFEPYKEPKTLVCLHTFCSDCIQKHVDSDSNRSSRFLLYSRYITCPLCRSKTEIPSGGIRKLQDNFLLSSLIDVLDRKRVGNVPPCEICHGEQPRASNHASHKCLDCAKLLCKSCVDLHMTTRVTQHHGLIDIEGEKDIECKKHPEEIVRYYCEPCEECVCIVCTFQEHRDHEICSFNDGFTKYRSGLDSLLVQCKERISSVQNRLSKINTVESTVKEMRDNIRDLAISYISQVRATERQLVQRVEEEFGSKIQGFVQNKEWLQENLEGLQTACSLAEVIMSDHGIEMLLLKKELQCKLSTLLEPALPMVPENLTHNIKFVPGNVQLGHISTSSNHDVVCDYGSVQKQKVDIECLMQSKNVCESRDLQTENGTSLTLKTMKNNSEILPSIHYTSQTSLFLNDLPHDDINVRSKNNANEYIAKTDVSVNTMFSLEDTNLTGVCVQCCAELKKCSESVSSLPVIDGCAPVIQDIIITNCSLGDKDRRRRRRSLIKSRRVQTDISLSNESLDGVLSPRFSSQESLNGSFRKHSSQNSLTAVAECVFTTSIGLDPIDFGPVEKPKVVTVNKCINTTENVKIRPASRSVKTNTTTLELREAATITTPCYATVDTQTLNKVTVDNKSIATDYTGQRNKRTSTPIIITMDNGTHMPTIRQETKVTWTESVQTTDRSICTEASEITEVSIETERIEVFNQCVGVTTEMKTIGTLTDLVRFADTSDYATGVKSKDKKVKSKERKEKSKDKMTKEKNERKLKNKYADSCIGTEQVMKSDKETGTFISHVRESWTATESTQMINTGISPVRPATMEVCIETNPVTLMEQATNTDVITLQESASETVILICDGETLTDRIGLQDAQTEVDLYYQNVETFTDASYLMENGCMTDAEWFLDNEREIFVGTCEVCQERKACIGNSASTLNVNTLEKNPILINTETQTIEIQLYDKAVFTSREFVDTDATLKGIAYNDMSTSTENLPYIGLFSDMDCDELILVPEIAIDVIGSEAEYQRIYENSFPSCVMDAEIQTLFSSADPNGDTFSAADCCQSETSSDLRYLITVGVNTDHKLTFEKETCTPSLHQLTKATSTSFSEKIDKATCTASHIKTIQENFLQSPSIERSLKVIRPIKKDICVETDLALLDEQMLACENKLETMSERLNSQTNKAFDSLQQIKSLGIHDDSIENEIKKIATTTGSDRKKSTVDLAEKSQAIVRTTETNTQPVRRKVQPLTTLKKKISDQNLECDLQSVNNAQQPEAVDQSNEIPENNANETNSTLKRTANSRRNNSAPGRIATVANQSVLRKASPRTNRSTVSKQDHGATLPVPKQNQGLDFYSTVPKVRQLKQGLASISENRHSSTGFEVPNTPSLSAVSELPSSSTSSLDKSLDFSSLKITAAPRAPSLSPTPQRTNGQEGRAARQPSTSKARIEVIPNIEIAESRVRTGSTSSDQTDEPSLEKKGFIKKLFGSKKKKSSEKRNASPGKSPKPGRKAQTAITNTSITNTAIATTDQMSDEAKQVDKEETKEKVKEKPKPFVYMRSRIFSIEQKDEDKYNKPTVNKYCVKKDEQQLPVFDFAATFTKRK